VLRDALRPLEKAEAMAEARCEDLRQSLQVLQGTQLRLRSSGLEALRAEQRLVEEALTSLDAAEAQERETAALAASAASDEQKLALELASVRERQAARTARLAEERTSLQAEARTLEYEEDALRAALKSAGLEVGEGLAPAVDEARGKVRALQEADAAFAAAERDARLAEAALAAAGERLTQAHARSEAAARQSAVRAQEVAALEPQAGQALEGRSPDAVEQALAAEQAEASLQARTSAAAAQALHVALAREASQVEAQVQRLTALAGEHEEVAGALARQRDALGFASEEALRGALLPADEAARLHDERQRLQRELDTAAHLDEERARDASRHEQERPPVREAWAGLPAAGLSAERERLELACDEAMRQGMSAAARLQAQEKAQAEQRERQQAFETARTALDTWERLHRLIGVGEGDAFKRYAQTLNLAELMARANVHLERLAPRYTLVGARTAEGASRLAFAIRDDFQAGEMRSINTLSGGETFLVSLALALGLAGYRQVKMPIETLLLDEGFGTLDPETLQVAMSALEALHATGTQVGIISHVEALQERIPSRVRVERDGAGRSSVRIELG